MDKFFCEDCGDTPGLISADRDCCAKCGGKLKILVLTAKKDAGAKIPCNDELEALPTYKLMQNVVDAADSLVESYRDDELDGWEVELLAKEIAALIEAGF